MLAIEKNVLKFIDINTSVLNKGPYLKCTENSSTVGILAWKFPLERPTSDIFPSHSCHRIRFILSAVKPRWRVYYLRKWELLGAAESANMSKNVPNRNFLWKMPKYLSSFPDKVSNQNSHMIYSTKKNHNIYTYITRLFMISLIRNIHSFRWIHF